MAEMICARGTRWGIGCVVDGACGVMELKGSLNAGRVRCSGSPGWMCLRFRRQYAGDDTEQAVAACGEDAFDGNEFLAGHHPLGLVCALGITLSASRQVRYLSSAAM